MNKVHYALWDQCVKFVGVVCADRDASHGLKHMQTVTESAVGIFLMEHAATYKPSDLQATLLRVIAVGMLHDVGDHKYDKDGTLLQQVATFAATISPQLPLAESEDAPVNGATQALLDTISAISYSTENKKGIRWYETGLPSKFWVDARNAVSDADKLEAIGVSGLLRCYEYAIHSMKDKGLWAKALQEHGVEGVGKQILLPHVVEHSNDKLFKLSREYMRTDAGAYLAKSRDEEMRAELQKWELSGPPPMPESGNH